MITVIKTMAKTESIAAIALLVTNILTFDMFEFSRMFLLLGHVQFKKTGNIDGDISKALVITF